MSSPTTGAPGSPVGISIADGSTPGTVAAPVAAPIAASVAAPVDAPVAFLVPAGFFTGRAPRRPPLTVKEAKEICRNIPPYSPKTSRALFHFP